MEECQAVVTRIPIPLSLPWRCSPRRCCCCHCCGVASVTAPHRSSEKQFQHLSVSSTISYTKSLGPEAVRPGKAALRGSSQVVPGYWGVRLVWHQLGTPIIPKSSVRRASHPKGCDDLRKAELGSRCIRTRDKDTREAVV